MHLLPLFIALPLLMQPPHVIRAWTMAASQRQPGDGSAFVNAALGDRSRTGLQYHDDIEASKGFQQVSFDQIEVGDIIASKYIGHRGGDVWLVVGKPILLRDEDGNWTGPTVVYGTTPWAVPVLDSAKSGDMTIHTDRDGIAGHVIFYNGLYDGYLSQSARHLVAGRPIKP
jgi:hypothetical protein